MSNKEYAKRCPKGIPARAGDLPLQVRIERAARRTQSIQTGAAGRPRSGAGAHGGDKCERNRRHRRAGKLALRISSEGGNY